jgi:uncharacterized protein YyaL (SSP411 family)
VLPKNDCEKFTELFGITKEGNFEDEATKKLTSKNIPHLSVMMSNDEASWFENVRKKLFKKREGRIHPLLDDKILTDWNALMIAALAKAGFALNEEKFTETAETAYRFLQKHLIKNGQLLHRFKDGEAAIPAMADDYAFLIWALIELYQATFKPEYLQQALYWNQYFLDSFWDEDKGGFYFSVSDEDQVYGRQKQIFDGAIPSSNSVAMMNLIRLSRLTGNTGLEEYADKIGQAFSADLIRSGASICQGIQSIQFLNADAKELSLIVDSNEKTTLLQALKSHFRPFSVNHIIDEDNRNDLADCAPYTASQQKIEGEPTLYVCEGFTCEQPIKGTEEIQKVLK